MRLIDKSTIREFSPNEFPYLNLIIFLVIWFVAVAINYYIKKILLINIDTPIYFPFSIFWPSLNIKGLPYAVVFLVIFYLVIRKESYKNIFAIYLIGLLLIVLGNLSLGDFYAAVIKPISGPLQYYPCALKIGDWRQWLAIFNEIQHTLICHANTHPPGAMLIYKLLFAVSKSPLWISVAFLLLSSIAIFLIYYIFREMGKDEDFSNQVAFLYAVLPSVNIYFLATLDAVIAMFVNIVLLGVVIILAPSGKGKKLLWGTIATFALIVVNLMTFGTIHLWLTFGILGLYLWIKKNERELFIFTMASGVAFLIVLFILYFGFHFNYLQSFLTASKVENPHGFMLLYDPLTYFATRVEDILEIAIFLSFGLIAYLPRIKYTLKDPYIALSVIEVSVLLLMFLIGAYRTGETARACLFIVGFVFIFLKELPRRKLKPITIIAGLQTIGMQLTGYFFW